MNLALASMTINKQLLEKLREKREKVLLFDFSDIWNIFMNNSYFYFSPNVRLKAIGIFGRKKHLIKFVWN